MNILLAESAGFCYGVRRAVELAERAAADGPVCLLGHLTHNERVIRRLEERGAVTIDSPDEAPEGSTVLIRAHGEPDSTYERLSARGCRIIDATCPNVTRIHDIVREAEARGRIPVVIGEAKHPEIAAILGCAKGGLVASDWEELSSILEKQPNLKGKPLTFVSQTTAIRGDWEKIVENTKKVCTNAEFFDTICGATSRRQSEAQKFAGRCDGMIVIGDRRSSNTRRLAQLCTQRCPLVVQAEGADGLDREQFRGVVTLGITAGASTPEWIIKEVYNKMSDEIMEIEQSFADMLEESIKPINTGDKVTGTVIAITPTEVQVDLTGTKFTASIPLSELSDDPDVKPEDVVKVGDPIEAEVVLYSDRDCEIRLSKKRLESHKNWETVENAVESKEPLEGTITEVNKGGLVANVKGVRVFIPASQSGKPRGADLADMIKSKVKMRITEVNKARRRVVGSIRAVASEARAAAAAEVWNNIENGKRYNGIVKSLTSYGAFVDIGGVDGMVHISELSWSRIKNPAEVVSVGDPVEVYVISFDPEKRKISLGMKDHSQEPWTVFTSKYEVGDVAPVRIVKLMTFGAFAEIVPGVDGLIHISQLSDHRVEKCSDAVHEGDVVDAKIIAIDNENKKVSLSIRAILDAAPKSEEEPAPAEAEPAAEPEAVEEAAPVEEPAPAEEAPAAPEAAPAVEEAPAAEEKPAGDAE